MDLTADTSSLAAAAAEVARSVSSALTEPLLSGLLLTARGDGVRLAGTDRERSVTQHCAATVHADGTVLVPARALAETLRALEVDLVRLAVERNRLTVRTPSARFALPLLDAALHPGVPEPPPVAGSVHGRAFARLCRVAAGAAVKDSALPMFSGVRVRAEGGRLGMVATDRYRLVIASLPWRPGQPELDALVPAELLADAARRMPADGEVAIHADADRAALCWTGTSIGTALLASPFIDEKRYAAFPASASVTLVAEELAGALRRVGLYADDRGAVVLQVADGEVRVRGSGQAGEAEELIKSSVDGQVEQGYRSRYLYDALRPFGERRVRLLMQEGMRATAVVPADSGRDDTERDGGRDEDGAALRYVVMPILPRRGES